MFRRFVGSGTPVFAQIGAGRKNTPCKNWRIVKTRKRLEGGIVEIGTRTVIDLGYMDCTPVDQQSMDRMHYSFFLWPKTYYNTQRGCQTLWRNGCPDWINPKLAKRGPVFYMIWQVLQYRRLKLETPHAKFLVNAMGRKNWREPNIC